VNFCQKRKVQHICELLIYGLGSDHIAVQHLKKLRLVGNGVGAVAPRNKQIDENEKT